MLEIPESLERELHPRTDRKISARILEMLGLDQVVCIHDVAEAVGCSNITARKNLCRLVKADLAVEKK
jgi:predicted ArsR family transcriptional regulator